MRAAHGPRRPVVANVARGRGEGRASARPFTRSSRSSTLPGHPKALPVRFCVSHLCVSARDIILLIPLILSKKLRGPRALCVRQNPSRGADGAAPSRPCTTLSPLRSFFASFVAKKSLSLCASASLREKKPAAAGDRRPATGVFLPPQPLFPLRPLWLKTSPRPCAMPTLPRRPPPRPRGGGFCRNGTFCRPFGGGGGIFCPLAPPRGRPGAAAPGKTAREKRRARKFTVDG